MDTEHQTTFEEEDGAMCVVYDSIRQFALRVGCRSNKRQIIKLYCFAKQHLHGKVTSGLADRKQLLLLVTRRVLHFILECTCVSILAEVFWDDIRNPG